MINVFELSAFTCALVEAYLGKLQRDARLSWMFHFKLFISCICGFIGLPKLLLQLRWAATPSFSLSACKIPGQAPCMRKYVMAKSRSSILLEQPSCNFPQFLITRRILITVYVGTHLSLAFRHMTEYTNTNISLLALPQNLSYPFCQDIFYFWVALRYSAKVIQQNLVRFLHLCGPQLIIGYQRMQNTENALSSSCFIIRSRNSSSSGSSL